MDFCPQRKEVVVQQWDFPARGAMNTHPGTIQAETREDTRLNYVSPKAPSSFCVNFQANRIEGHYQITMAALRPTFHSGNCVQGNGAEGYQN